MSPTWFADPQHPYTIGLLASIPSPRTSSASGLATIEGTRARPQQPAERGCRYRAALPVRRTAAADLNRRRCETVAPGHRVACWKAPVEVASERGPGAQG